MAYQTVALNDFKSASHPTDSRFLALLDKLPPLSKSGPWLAGGSVRKYMNGIQNKADYDIFFASEGQRDVFIAELEAGGAKFLTSNIFNHSYDLDGYKIQCIHHEYCNTLIQTLNRFDITICQFGFDGTNLVWSDEAGQDARSMLFHFVNVQDPVYNFNRAFKYAREGYKPADGEVKRVLMKVARDPKGVYKNRKEISPEPISQADLTAVFQPLVVPTGAVSP